MEPTLLIDTREQLPLMFDDWPTASATLPVGDYGIAGFSDWDNPRFVVERKSLSDLIGSLTFGRDRFMREVEKLRQFGFAAIVIEASEAEVLNGNYNSRTPPQSILASLAAIQVRAGVHILWVGDRHGAEVCVKRLARQFGRGIAKDAKRIEAACEANCGTQTGTG